MDLEYGMNRGDGGDVFPGYTGNNKLDGTTTPATTTYAGQDSLVSLSGISEPGPVMTASARVGAGTGDAAGDGDLSARLSAVEERLSRLQQAVAAAAAALSQSGPAGAGTWSPRSRT